jgi:arylsulfatase A-like enzyme/Flp pilus assembly protein TadD
MTKSKLRLSIVIVFVIVVLAWLGFRHNHTLSSLPDTIILISLDTTRADHLGTYGYRFPTTPNIDALAKESVVFEHAFADIPLTLPSHSSMLTSQIPPAHGVHDNLATALPETATTLPEVLKVNGYATYGIVSAIVLNHEYGLSQGFDTYDDVFEATDTLTSVVERSGDETTAHAIKWLKENADKKKFMFLHYFDPHFTYEPPAPFDRQFKHPYDGEIAFVDHCIGQFIDQLKAQKEYDNALIVLTADHGEMLGEHGELTHTYFIYQSAIKVPLVVKFPQSKVVKRVSEPCGLIDIPPTVLSLAGIEIPETMTGVDLSQYRNDEYTQPKRGLYSESLTATKYNGNRLLGIIEGPWHYIQTTRPELYNRLADPKEQVNLIRTNPRLAGKLQADLANILESVAQNEQDTSVEIDQNTVNMLESLGYVGGTIDADISFDSNKPDPKDLLDVHGAFSRVITLTQTGRLLESVEQLEELIRDYPDIALAYKRLAGTYVLMGDWDNTIEAIQKLLTLTPDDVEALEVLARAYRSNKQYQEAIDTLHRVIKINPDETSARYALIQSYFLLGDIENALKYALKVVELDDKHVPTRVALAETYLALGKYKEAIVHFEIAFALNKDLTTGLNDVAWLQASQKDAAIFNPVSALRYAERAAALLNKAPANEEYEAQVLDTLAVALAANGKFEEAVEAATKAHELSTKQGKAAFAKRIQGRITLYEQEQAYRE